MHGKILFHTFVPVLTIYDGQPIGTNINQLATFDCSYSSAYDQSVAHFVAQTKNSSYVYDSSIAC